MNTFWSQGYDGTSMSDLLTATQLHKGSLYKAFGDKRSLYITALKRYMEFVHDMLSKVLSANPTVRGGLRQWFQVMITRRTDISIKGCFAANASAEMAPRDPEIAHLLRDFTARLTAKFQRAIESGKDTGELAADIDSKVTAEHLTITMFGIHVVGKHSPRSSALVDAILAPLE